MFLVGGPRGEPPDAGWAEDLRGYQQVVVEKKKTFFRINKME